MDIMLAPGDNYDISRKLGWIRLKIEADAEHLPDIPQSEMFAYVRRSVAKLLMEGDDGELME